MILSQNVLNHCMCFLSWNFREPEKHSCSITKISIWTNHYPAVFILFNRYTKSINVWWTEFRRKDKKQFSVFRYHNYTIQKTAFFVLPVYPFFTIYYQVIWKCATVPTSHRHWRTAESRGPAGPPKKYLECDIYITGSNAKLLSSELATYLAWRYVEFVIYPFLSWFFYALSGNIPGGNRTESIFIYLTLGGMPYQQKPF